MSSGASRDSLRVLTLDGSISTASAISELFIAQLIAHRWAWANDPDEREADDIPVSELFDVIGGTGMGGFYAILFAVLNMTIGQAITSHNILNDQLFSTEEWMQEDRMASSSALDSALDMIFKENQIQVDLDSPFGSKGEPIKCFVCVVNDKNTTHPRILRNYRIRTSPNPRCTIRQALRATLADGTHLPPVVLQHERLVSGVPRFANISRALMKELPVAFPKDTLLACFVNIGSGHPDAHSVAQELSSQYHDLDPCYFRLSLHREVKAVDETYSHTTEYLGADEVSTQIDCIVDTLVQRHGVVSMARLGSLAGEDGKAKLLAQMEAVHEDVGYIRTNMDKNIFRSVKEWLQPVDHTAKLDENIQARGATTCEWFLEQPGVMKWKSGPGGSCWFHGAMGTGKTVIISYLIQSLIQGGFAVAYYYFDFTNSKTLSEEALFRSLVAQLSHINEACARVMYEKHTQGAVQPQLATLQDAFYKLVSETVEPVYVVIDALDELPCIQRARLLKTLEDAWSSPRPRFYLIVTSRDEVDISECLEEKVQFKFAVADAMVRHDIAVVIEKELSSEKWKSWPKTERAMLKEHLNRRADGQFRVVACQIEVLRQVQTSRDLRKTLQLLPKKLGDTYSYILQSIPEELRGRAHTLLSILSFAFEPVPLSELSTLLAVELEDSTDEFHLPEYCEDSRYHQPQNIVGLGSALIRTERPWGPAHPPFLRLAHASVKEYLLQNDVHWYFINERLAHETISRVCLALLLYNQTQEADNRLMVDAYVKLWWYHHVPSNGCKQLLAQQLSLFHAFPWSSLRDFEIPLDAIGHVTQSDLLEYPLAAAAAAGLVDLLHIMLATDIDRNTLTHALVVAAAAGARLPVITLLVTRGADVNAFNKNIGTPLQSAAAVGDLEVVQFLVRVGASVNLEGGYYDTPLNAAASEGKLHVIEFLLSEGADVNLVGRDYGTPLQAAASLGRLDVVELLVANGADTNIVAGVYGTALQAAAFIGSLDVVEFLVKNRAYLDIIGGKYGTALQAAAYEGEMRVVKFLIGRGADPNIVAGELGTALHAAACRGYLNVVKFLIENGADINIIGGKYGVPLLAAASEGEMEVVGLLSENGGDTNIMRNFFGGDTAGLNEMTGTRFDSQWLELTYPNRQFSLSAGSNTVRDDRAPQQRVYTGTLRWMAPELLVNPDSTSHNHRAPRNIRPWNPADPYTVDQNRPTPLHVAAYQGDFHVVEALLASGVDPNTANTAGLTPLHWAVKKGYLDVVRILLKSRANPNATSPNYRKPLHIAVIHVHVNVVHALLKHDANPNAANHNDRTPLHLAAMNGHLNVVQMLLRSNASPYNTDKSGRTPFQIAASNGHLDIMHALMRSERRLNAFLRNNPNALHLDVDQSVPHWPMKRRRKRVYEKKRF